MNIIKQGKTLSFFKEDAFENLKHLENKVYTVMDSMFGAVLIEEEDFKFPEKIYGNEEPFVKHVLNYYNHSDKNVAVALVGQKGQGKSLTAKLLCRESKLPVILIKSKASVHILEFIANLEDNVVVFVDEFEKLYKEKSNQVDEDGNSITNNDQEMWLSILDGNTVFKNKVLFVFTSNSDLSEYLVDRPSRIRYLKEYKYLNKEIVEQYLNDNLKDKSKIEEFISVISLKNLNLDILSELVKEVNFSNMSVKDIISIFNYTPNHKITYNMSVYDDKGELVHTDIIQRHEIIPESRPHESLKDCKEYVHLDNCEFLNISENNISFKCSIYRPETEEVEEKSNEGITVKSIKSRLTKAKERSVKGTVVFKDLDSRYNLKYVF
jgi:SpoVK/Ycf46/Vps4 family AAA+-type ATPase